MRVKCKKIISSTSNEDLGSVSPWLSTEKIYIVLGLEINLKQGINVYIQSDHFHEPILLSLNGFEIISQHMSSNWGVQFNSEDNTVLIIPRSWIYNSFFEDLEDQESTAMMLFKKESELIYSEENSREHK